MKKITGLQIFKMDDFHVITVKKVTPTLEVQNHMRK